MTSFQLKLIAIFAMTIDHIAKILSQPDLMAVFPAMTLHTSYVLMGHMGSIGRLAFPLFAFMLVEGTQKTRSMPRYIGRLGLFAVISQPFFYFSHWRVSPTVDGFFQELLRLNFGNVFFTLALGAIAIYVCQLLERRQVNHAKLWCIGVFALFGWLAEYIDSDYGLVGIALIGGVFLAKTIPQKCAVTLVWIALLYGFGQAYNPIGSVLRDCLFAALSCVFIWFYNGQRGRPMKWSFYIYYPAHLLVLTLAHFAIAS